MAHATQHVPYFHDLGLPVSESAEPTEVFSALKQWPLLTKDIIRREDLNMRAMNIDASRFIPNATSGSTGESLRFFLDAHSKNFRAASTYRFFKWCGIKPTDRRAQLWGARFDEPHGSGPTNTLKRWLHPELFLSSYEMSEQDMRRYLSMLQRFRPHLLISYPSPLERFSRYCADQGVRLDSLRAIITSAEQLHEHQRVTIEHSFGTRIFNRYGSREFGNIAQECPQHHGLHVAADSFFVEVLDDDGKDCPPGVIGHIVITDLRNEAMPFIRYRTGDLGTWSSRQCSCGITLPMLETLEGRTLDLVRGPEGHVISGTFWPQILKQACPAIRNFQIHQKTVQAIQIDLLMEPKRKLTQSELEHILAKVGEYAPGLEVGIDYVDGFISTPSGKHRMVISELPSEDSSRTDL